MKVCLVLPPYLPVPAVRGRCSWNTMRGYTKKKWIRKKGYLLNPYAYDMKNNILYGYKDKVITNETIESKAQEFITLYQEEFNGIY